MYGPLFPTSPFQRGWTSFVGGPNFVNMALVVVFMFVVALARLGLPDLDYESRVNRVVPA